MRWSRRSRPNERAPGRGARLIPAAVAVGLMLLGPTSRVRGEPQFLSKQYTRCVTCHYSPTGGGLLTPYGRALSRAEISTFGRGPEDRDSEERAWREEAALYGLFGDALGPVDVGADLRPSHLRLASGGSHTTRDFWMRADLEVAVRLGRWTGYGELGRLAGDDPEFVSREHWLAYAWDSGVGFRAGRFLPAFGIRNADHTAFNRRDLGFDQNDQIYGAELSYAGERHLVQFALGPGYAQSLIKGGDRDAWTAAVRIQTDYNSRNVLVVSGLYRGSTHILNSSWIGSIAYGYSPHRRVSLWTELDARASKGWRGTPEYVIVHEVAVELRRGVWLKFSPQLKTALYNVKAGTSRLALGAQFLPRPHWDLSTMWYRDRERTSGLVFTTLLFQAHLYL